MIGIQEDEIALKFAQGWAKPVKKNKLHILFGTEPMQQDM